MREYTFYQAGMKLKDLSDDDKKNLPGSGWRTVVVSKVPNKGVINGDNFVNGLEGIERSFWYSRNAIADYTNQLADQTYSTDVSADYNGIDTDHEAYVVLDIDAFLNATGNIVMGANSHAFSVNANDSGVWMTTGSQSVMFSFPNSRNFQAYLWKDTTFKTGDALPAKEPMSTGAASEGGDYSLAILHKVYVADKDDSGNYIYKANGQYKEREQPICYKYVFNFELQKGSKALEIFGATLGGLVELVMGVLDSFLQIFINLGSMVIKDVVVPLLFTVVQLLWNTVMIPLKMLVITVLYFALMGILWMLDGLGTVVNVFAGITPVTYTPAGPDKKVSMLEVLMFYSPTVKKLFWTVTIIGMLIAGIFTLYTAFGMMFSLGQQPKTAGKVIGAATKSMLTFIMVPGMTFISLKFAGLALGAAINASHVNGSFGEYVLYMSVIASKKYSENLGYFKNYEQKYIADHCLREIGKDKDGKPIYEQYRKYYSSKYPSTSETTVDDANKYTYKDILAYMKTQGAAGGFDEMRAGMDFRTFEPIGSAEEFIKLYNNNGNAKIYTNFAVISENGISWFMALISSILSLWIYLVLSLVFVERMFEIAILYVMSPFFAASIALDTNQYFKNWRDFFIGRVIMGFSLIFMLNLVLAIVPWLWSPNVALYTGSGIGAWFMNLIAKVVIIIGGFWAVPQADATVIPMIVGWMGGQGASETFGTFAGAIGTTLGFVPVAGKYLEKGTQMMPGGGGNIMNLIGMAKGGGGGGGGEDKAAQAGQAGAGARPQQQPPPGR
jgi:hypothetical protein